ncbi:hypothetical protein [Micromonospora craniellae]|nr:hypothetical protein [Micromonospora craniellae]
MDATDLLRSLGCPEPQASETVRKHFARQQEAGPTAPGDQPDRG